MRELFGNAPSRVWPDFVIVETLYDESGEVADMLRTNGYSEAARFRMNSVYARSGV